MINRAYSLLEIKRVSDETRTITGVATTPSADRMGDIVEPLGVKFKNPLPLLHQHRSDQPVGTVTFDKPSKNGITFTARFPKIDVAGPLQDRVETAYGEVKAGLVRGVSIGFRSIEHSRIESGGLRFLQSEVLELSLVSVPANQDATITTIKNIDSELLARDRAPQQDVVDKTPAGDTARKTTPVVRTRTMARTMSERIADFEATRAAKTAMINKLMDKVAEENRTKDASEKEDFDTLTQEIDSIDSELIDLRKAEKLNITKAVPVAGDTPERAAETRQGARVQVIGPRMEKGGGMARILSARYIAKEDGGHPADIALAKGWGDDIATCCRIPRDIVLRAAVNPATTTDSTWAGPLVIYQNLQNEFIELLRAKSIINRIPGLRRVPFNTKIPRETTALTAYWVGQGAPKPVSKGAFDTITLDFNKVAGITYLTQELLRFSTPSAEPILVNSLTQAITKLIDYDFLNPAKTASAGISPASVTNGSTSIAATGTTADAFRADFANLMARYAGANYSLSGLVLIMTESQAMRLGMLRNDFGNREFPDIGKEGGTIEGVSVVTSENIIHSGGSPSTSSLIVAMNAYDVLLADDGGVDVSVSTEASIQANDSPDNPTTASSVLVSLWQNNLVGIRCERFITWGKARADSVVYISNANYIG